MKAPCTLPCAFFKEIGGKKTPCKGTKPASPAQPPRELDQTGCTPPSPPPPESPIGQPRLLSAVASFQLGAAWPRGHRRWGDNKALKVPPSCVDNIGLGEHGYPKQDMASPPLAVHGLRSTVPPLAILRSIRWLVSASEPHFSASDCATGHSVHGRAKWSDWIMKEEIAIVP